MSNSGVKNTENAGLMENKTHISDNTTNHLFINSDLNKNAC